MKNIFNLIVISMLGINYSQADSLSSYRKSMSGNDQSQAAIVEMANETLQLLGVHQSNLSPILNPNPSQLGSPKQLSSSALVKILMDPAIRELVKVERYGKPIVFEPSSTFGKKESRDIVRQRRTLVCVETLSKEAVENRMSSSGDLPIETVLRELKSLIEYKIENNSTSIEPTREIKSLVQGGIESALGPIQSMDIQDGVISAFRFSGKNSETKITLSTLMTFLSDEDFAFIAMMDCLVDQVKPRVEKAKTDLAKHEDLVGPIDRLKNLFSSERRSELAGINLEKAKFDLEFYGPLLSYLEEKATKAKEIGSLLTSMKHSDVVQLFGLLLRTQLLEIPTSDELQIISEKTGAEINSLIRSQSKDDKSSSLRVNQLTADINGFRQAQIQLSRLKDYLVEKNQIKRNTAEIIQSGLGGGK